MCENKVGRHLVTEVAGPEVTKESADEDQIMLDAVHQSRFDELSRLQSRFELLSRRQSRFEELSRFQSRFELLSRLQSLLLLLSRAGSSGSTTGRAATDATAMRERSAR